MSETYYKTREQNSYRLLQEVLNRLPDFGKSFINSKNYTLAVQTRLGYARDLEMFFYFVTKTNPLMSGKKPRDVTFAILESLTPQDIDEYMAFLESYEYEGKTYSNSSSGKRRKLASVRELYKHLCKYGSIRQNPALLVDTPKDSLKKSIRALNGEEKRSILASIDNKDAKNNNINIRDRAIIMLFLGTGIRVSELVGLNLDDVNMKYHFITVISKGGKYQHHYFNEEVFNCLTAYNDIRLNFHPVHDEGALFLSKQGKRLCVRSVELMVKKYSSIALGNKDAISPHKLRSTYGTDLYAMTGDIALVSDNLGHADISTTKKYYAKQNLDNLKRNKDFKIFE